MGKCTNPANHANHICQLKIQQKFDEVKKLGKDATFFCSNCESPTTDPQKVCVSAPYQGKVGILKWKK